MKRLFQIGSVTCLLWCARWTQGQAVPTAERVTPVQIGAAWSVASPDYGQRNVQGFSIYGTLDLTPRWGIEGDIHRATIITPTHIGEDSYLLGPRYAFHYNRWQPYAKVLLGFGRFKFLYDNVPHTTYTYKIYTFGGGVDLHATKHVNVRAIDFEYQQWPEYQPNGLSPAVITFGAAYAFR